MIRIQEQVMYDKPRTNIMPNVEKQSVSSIIRNKTRCPVSLLFCRVLFILVKAIRQEKERQIHRKDGSQIIHAVADAQKNVNTSYSGSHLKSQHSRGWHRGLSPLRPVWARESDLVLKTKQNKGKTTGCIGGQLKTSPEPSGERNRLSSRTEPAEAALLLGST